MRRMIKLIQIIATIFSVLVTLLWFVVSMDDPPLTIVQRIPNLIKPALEPLSVVIGLVIIGVGEIYKYFWPEKNERSVKVDKAHHIITG